MMATGKIARGSQPARKPRKRRSPPVAPSAEQIEALSEGEKEALTEETARLEADITAHWKQPLPESEETLRAKIEEAKGLAYRRILAQRSPPSHVLGIGDYEHPDSDTQQRAARRYFLDAAQRRRREIIATLASTVFPAYEGIAPSTGAEDLRSWEQEEAEADTNTGGLPALHQWAEDWCLSVPWVKQCALDTLADWRVRCRLYAAEGNVYGADSMVRHGWQHEAFGYWGPLTEEEERFSLPAMPGYHPDSESRQQAEFRIRRVFDAYLRAHLDGIEALMQAREWRKKPEKRTADHFLWTVEFQVCKLDYAEIGRQRHATRKAVSDAVHDIAALIELPLRKSPPGRRRKITAANGV